MTVRPSRRQLLAALAAPGATTPAPLARLVAERMRRFQIPGMTVVVLRAGRVIYARGHGLASLEHALPASERTVYQVGSVAKIVAATTAMLLVQDGKIALDARLDSLLPDLPPGWGAIQFQHLLSHTSGLPGRVSVIPAYQEEEKRRKDKELYLGADKLDLFTAAEQLAYLKQRPLATAPGAVFSYGFTGYLLVGMILERLTGKPYVELVQQRLFDPLGMKSCRFGDSRVVVPGRTACAYTRQIGGVLQNWVWSYATTGYPAAGLNTSAPDLARLVQALGAGQLLRPELRDRMWTPPTLGGGKPSRYGLGWSVYDLDGHRAVGHEGAGCAWVTHLPDDGISVVALSNMAGARADDTADELARAALAGR